MKKGNDGAEIEEERREYFIAVTRAGKRLILSRAAIPGMAENAFAISGGDGPSA